MLVVSKDEVTPKQKTQFEEWKMLLTILEYFNPDIPVDFMVDIIKVTEDEKFVYVIYEDGLGQTLESLLREKEFDEDQACLIAYEVIRALQVLKNFNLHHGGIFPANIYEKNGSIKLGLPNFKKVRQKVRVKSKLKNYYAPEKEKVFASDLWSIGILLVDLMKGRVDDNSDANQTSSDKKPS